MRRKKVNFNDNLLKGITYSASFILIAVLVLIIGFIAINGFELLSWEVLTNDYNSKTHRVSIEKNDEVFVNPNLGDNVYFSYNFGVAITDGENIEGIDVIQILHVDKNSPFLEATNPQNEVVRVEPGILIDGVLRANKADGSLESIFSNNGAEEMIRVLDQSDVVGISAFDIKIEGGGIRASILTTLYLIVLTLIIAIPLGVGAAVYLHEMAPRNKFTKYLESFIDLLNGIPSIIFGLMGAALFIPLTTTLFNNKDMQRGSLIAGALTLVVIILPVIIKTTITALEVVPDSLRSGSLALGANKTQTAFKVVLPNAFVGILSGVLLSIGRIIGESAALIFAMGTFIGDNVTLTGRSTSLAVHIWVIMGGESPNIRLASTIALIILVVVLILNFLIKLLTNRFVKKQLGGA